MASRQSPSRPGDNDCELRDDKNPDPAARRKTIIGLVVLHGLKQLDAE
jgi:hypothetical protein